MQNSTHLTIVKILITLILFFGIPFATEALAVILESRIIATTIVVNTVTLILVIYNFNILELHYRRIQNMKKDTFFFILIGFVLSFIFSFAYKKFVGFDLLLLDKESLNHYSFFMITILLAYTFFYSVCYGLAFKCFTNQFKIKENEAAIIFFSAISFGFIMTLTQFGTTLFQVQWFSILLTFFYHFFIAAITSYLYNQTNSIIPMMISYGFTLLIIALI